MQQHHYSRTKSPILPVNSILDTPCEQASFISHTDWFDTPLRDEMTKGAVVSAIVYLPSGSFHLKFLALLDKASPEDPVAFHSLDDADHFRLRGGAMLGANEVFLSYFADTANDSERHQIYTNVMRVILSHA